MNPQPNQGMVYNTYNPYDQNQNSVPQEPKKLINLPLIIGIAVGGIAIIILILFLTGVLGGKKLTCSMEYDTFGRTSKQEVIIKFNDEKPKRITMKMTMDNLTSAEVESVKQGFSYQLDGYEEDGYKVDLTTTDNSVTLSVTANDLELLDIDSDDETYETIKEGLEEEGFTCK